MNILIDIIKISALTLVFFYIVLMWLPAFLTLRKDYKYYKKTYDLLNSKTYVLTDTNEQYLTFREKSKKYDIFYCDEILYFKDDDSLKGDIKLTNSGYIHVNNMLWMDPYTMYWYHKIKKQIIINSSVENMRDNTLSKLGIR